MIVILMPPRLRLSLTLTNNFLPRFVLMPQMAKLPHRCLIRCPFGVHVNADKITHRGRVMQVFLNPRIRQFEPHLQHPLQRQWRSVSGFADLEVKRINHRSQPCSGHDHLHVGKKPRAARRLVISLQSRQCLLFLASHPMNFNDQLHSAGQSKFP